MEFFFNDGDTVTIRDDVTTDSLDLDGCDIPVTPELLDVLISDAVEFSVIENRWHNEGEKSFNSNTLSDCDTRVVMIQSCEPVEGMRGRIHLLIDDQAIMPTPETLSSLLQRYDLDL